MRQFKLTERYTPRSTKSIGYYYSEVEKNKLLSIEEENQVAFKARQGDQKARDLLVKSNLRFVLSVAKMYTRDPEIFPDLVSAGNIGLIEAAEKFDPSKGFKFISYAIWHIRKEMIDFLSKNSRVVRIPQNRSNLLITVRRVHDALYSKNGYEPSSHDIVKYIRDNNLAESCGGKTITPEELEITLAADRKHSSIDSPVGESEDFTLLDLMASDSTEHDEVNMEGTVRPIMESIFSVLDPIEKDIVFRVNGLSDPIRGNEPLSSVAEDLEVSVEAVRSRYKKAIKKLQLKARKMRIDPADIFS